MESKRFTGFSVKWEIVCAQYDTLYASFKSEKYNAYFIKLANLVHTSTLSDGEIMSLVGQIKATSLLGVDAPSARDYDYIFDKIGKSLFFLAKPNPTV